MNRTRRWHGILVLLAALTPFTLAGDVGSQPGTKRLNVLFIAVDDLRPALGCYGHPIARTPHLDRLSARGLRFERAYCQYPLCNPSRTSLLTGRYPTATGVMDNRQYFRDLHPDVVTLPQHFRANGYVAARTGKIFHGGIDDLPSWDEGGERGQARPARTPEQAAQYRQQSDRWVAVEGEGENLADYRSATRAIELLEKYRERPFFIAVGFAKPHTPLIAPQRYFDLYDPEKIPLPSDFAPDITLPPGVPEGALGANGDLFIRRKATEKEAREMIRAYYACVSFVDAQVGRILEALDRLKLRDHTVIVFFGDHGFHLGEKGKWSKHNSLFEPATRVSLVIAVPGGVQAGEPAARRQAASLPRGRVCDRTVELIDLYPTLVELCGLPRPPGLEGDSLAPLLRDPRARWEHPAYTYNRGRLGLGQSVRTERYRYTVWEGGSRGVELYDHTRDPEERRNLAGGPAYAPIVERMKRLLR